MGSGALVEQAGQLALLLWREQGGGALRSGCQGPDTSLGSRGVPGVDGLSAHAEHASDLGLGVLSFLEQGSGELASVVEFFEGFRAREYLHAL